VHVSRHLNEIESFVLRPADFSLSDDQGALRDVVRTFLGKECPAERVRAAEPLGWDADLWQQMAELRLVAMGVPADRGGDGAGLVELAVVAEELGRAAAPVPFVDAAVTARLLARLAGEAADGLLAGCLAGDVVSLTVADAIDGRFLVPSGAITTTVLARSGDAVVAATAAAPPPHVDNVASAPMAWWALDAAAVLAEGTAAVAAFEEAQVEWRLLTAAALVGVGDAAKQLAADYARERTAFGHPIGSFQAVAHPLADLQIALDSGRRLVRKAAWFLDHEPASAGPLPTMAFVHAAESAERAGLTAIQTQGGFGFMLESDVQLFYRRAKGWSLVGGSLSGHLRHVADDLLGVIS
jgi:alkylation response protein AidB-like acyl-CoA dehydrogenase